MAILSHDPPSAGTNPNAALQTLQEENHRLRRAVEELSVINDLARAISASLDPQQVMDTIIHRSLRAVGAEQGVITLVDTHADDPMKTFVRAMESSADGKRFHFNQALLGWMLLNKKPLLLADPRTDERFKGIPWEAQIHSLLCVPMMVKSTVHGVLTVYNKREGACFTEEDQRLLAIIAAQSAQVVENARLNEAEKQLLKVQQEIELASKIQRDLLPASAPSVSGYQVAGRSIPAQVVGGDLYDFITLDDGRLAFCLGDVSGKGLPASLLMANTQATVRGQTPITPMAKECVRKASKLLFNSTSPERFVTMFYAMLDPLQHQLWYSNAGHDNPYLFSRDEKPIRLRAGGPPLGMLEDFPFEEGSVSFAPGDMLVVCSDGITEAMNPWQVQFGEERVEALIRDHRNDVPAVLMDALFAAVRAHAAGAPQADDMTLVVVKREND